MPGPGRPRPPPAAINSEGGERRPAAAERSPAPTSIAQSGQAQPRQPAALTAPSPAPQQPQPPPGKGCEGMRRDPPGGMRWDAGGRGGVDTAGTCPVELGWILSPSAQLATACTQRICSAEQLLPTVSFPPVPLPKHQDCVLLSELPAKLRAGQGRGGVESMDCTGGSGHRRGQQLDVANVPVPSASSCRTDTWQTCCRTRWKPCRS